MDWEFNYLFTSSNSRIHFHQIDILNNFKVQEIHSIFLLNQEHKLEVDVVDELLDEMNLIHHRVDFR